VRYGLLIFAAAALSSSLVSAGELQSVYVAPGGVYIANARVYVAPGTGEPPYVAPGASYGVPGYGAPGPAYGAPGYVAPAPAYGAPGYGTHGPAYGAPAYYGSARSVHSAPPVYVEREHAYPSAYAAEYVPRPPAAIPYNGGGRCIVNLGYGRRGYCN
jgi:hypothetical protein